MGAYIWNGAYPSPDLYPLRYAPECIYIAESSASRVTYICYSKLTLFIRIFKRQYCGNNLALIHNIFKGSASFACCLCLCIYAILMVNMYCSGAADGNGKEDLYTILYIVYFMLNIFYRIFCILFFSYNISKYE